MSSLPNNVSESTRRRNPHLYSSAEVIAREVPESEKFQVLPKRSIIRVTKSAEEKLNKTEKRFLAHLRTKYHGCRVGIQDMTLRLAADLRYTPDFSVWEPNCLVHFYEVKGKHVWDDAKAKIKMAAAMFPMFRFQLAYEDRGEWITQDVPK